ncbi:MAG: hypothetical protein JXA11_03930, partial [Phycisphaerae bacterium]|nr:hypothetical protein [Phycisphaerae bacterium]
KRKADGKRPKRSIMQGLDNMFPVTLLQCPFIAFIFFSYLGASHLLEDYVYYMVASLLYMLSSFLFLLSVESVWRQINRELLGDEFDKYGSWRVLLSKLFSKIVKGIRQK